MPLYLVGYPFSTPPFPIVEK